MNMKSGGYLIQSKVAPFPKGYPGFERLDFLDTGEISLIFIISYHAHALSSTLSPKSVKAIVYLELHEERKNRQIHSRTCVVNCIIRVSYVCKVIS